MHSPPFGMFSDLILGIRPPTDAIIATTFISAWDLKVMNYAKNLD